MRAQTAPQVQFESSPPATAQTARVGPSSPVADEEIIVTGSRVRRTGFTSGVVAEPTRPARSATARDAGGGWATDRSQGAPQFAQAPGSAKPAADASGEGAPGATAGGDSSAQVASDGRAGPLLIYEATLWLAVYEVEAKQAEVLTLVNELGGFLSEQTGHHLVVRVPAARFQAAIDGIEKVGDVVERNIRAQDVTDQFRDLTLRLKNALEVRDRLAALLAKAQGVEDSLAIERELDRVTELVEMLKGQLDALSDRIAFSTITIQFGVRAQPSIDPDFNLPFRWIQRLGLDTLLTL